VAEDIIDDVIDAVEDLFPHKPGGMIDRMRAEDARREAAQKEREQAAEHIEERSYKAVKIVQLGPEISNVNIVNIPAGGTQMILPNSPYRFFAVFVSSVAITIGKDQGQALSGGYPIAPNVPFQVNSRAQIWASAATPAVVSIYTESYGPELY